MKHDAFQKVTEAVSNTFHDLAILAAKNAYGDTAKGKKEVRKWRRWKAAAIKDLRKR